VKRCLFLSAAVAEITTLRSIKCQLLLAGMAVALVMALQQAAVAVEPPIFAEA
jgi:hypothetical protein